ncbi:hypothetical protein GCM10009665_42860 [Kitasatospora nipponensis]|uniref:Uncharacterized protein n=1 Tax=Kitasatospora nipponensis TaxID=258049 RepID=A0ABN1WGX2_9ACTN
MVTTIAAALLPTDTEADPDPDTEIDTEAEAPEDTSERTAEAIEAASEEAEAAGVEEPPLLEQPARASRAKAAPAARTARRERVGVSDMATAFRGWALTGRGQGSTPVTEPRDGQVRPGHLRRDPPVRIAPPHPPARQVHPNGPPARAAPASRRAAPAPRPDRDCQCWSRECAT